MVKNTVKETKDIKVGYKEVESLLNYTVFTVSAVGKLGLMSIYFRHCHLFTSCKQQNTKQTLKGNQ